MAGLKGASVNGLLPGCKAASRPRLARHLVFHFSFRLPWSFLALIHFDDGPLIGVSLVVLLVMIVGILSSLSSGEFKTLTKWNVHESLRKERNK